MLNWLQNFGRFWIDLAGSLGRANIFLSRLLLSLPSLLVRFSLVVRQLYASGA